MTQGTLPLLATCSSLSAGQLVASLLSEISFHTALAAGTTILLNFLEPLEGP